MNVFESPLCGLEEYNEIKKKLSKNKGILQLSGCVESQRVHMMHALGDGFHRKIIVTFNEQKAEEMYEDMKLFGEPVVLYPAKDFIFFNADIKSNLLVKKRMSAIKTLLEEDKVTFITTIDGLMDSLVPLEVIRDSVIEITEESTIEVAKLTKQLFSMGYEKTGQVESAGQFAVRGGIIDIFPLTEENPYRIELWDDEVDSIRSFEAEGQRSIENVGSVRIYPASELIITEEIKEQGLKKIKAEAKEMYEALRAQMKTEEAHRITRHIEELEDDLLVLGCANADSHVKSFYDNTVSLLSYFTELNEGDGNQNIVFLDEPNRIYEKGNVVETEFRESMLHRIEKGYMLPSQAEIMYGFAEVMAMIEKCNTVAISTLEPNRTDYKVKGKYSLMVKNISSYNNSFELLVKELKNYRKNGYKVLLLSASRLRGQRLAGDLLSEEIPAFYSEDLEHELQPGEVMVSYGNVHRGYEYSFIKFVVISESDIFGTEKKRKKKRKHYEGQKISSFTDLQIGDYVVHENHGLGIYKGIEKITVDKVAKDYMKIEYASGGNLYILATQLDVIQKYAGADAKAPKLNKLGSKEWQKTKSRVKGAVDVIAKDLVELYAARQEKNGYVYGEDTVWQKEFEEMFPYEETEDQLLAIEAAKKDMESTKIMDRLICGDVGYGKTEIAIRTAFKAVQEGKQVVYLVPTTILAQQHYNTFVQRMKDFPVTVELMSRFRTPAQQKKTIEGLGKGLVDIVIGTHRVLSKDIKYKDLGLLIIDEEQRFGVAHKEKIKKLKENIDVLTLTATPIPRTLHMSLIGIRDMSVLEEPPMDRLPIQTFVMEFNEEMVREAINRELARGGQVFYVYNRINNIDEIANMVAALVPDANVAFAHGRMREHELENIMYDFMNGDIDVLVSTTIIETGLDISNVNTIIIHDSDNMGLSQLYQLRGRVGRSNRTAYAFLMYQKNKMLKETAEKRLQAIREYTELGSGFKIAMRDLEIRGAGNLLGERQSGHMEAVGYDLYCKMLNSAVKKYKGIEEEKDFETSIDISISAFIPPDYIPNEFQKLDIYKRIAAIENENESDDMLEELIDRFGEPPRSVMNLLAIANVKNMAHEVYVTEVSDKGAGIKFVMYEKAKVNLTHIPALLEQYKGQLTFKPEAVPYFVYQEKGNKLKSSPNLLENVKIVLNDLKMLLDQ